MDGTKLISIMLVCRLLKLFVVVSDAFQRRRIRVHLQLVTNARCSCPVCHWWRHLH